MVGQLLTMSGELHCLVSIETARDPSVSCYFPGFATRCDGFPH